jgi:hypothetical protein
MALGDGRFVHAPSSNGVVRIEHYTSYWASRFVGARASRTSRTIRVPPRTPADHPSRIRPILSIT